MIRTANIWLLIMRILSTPMRYLRFARRLRDFLNHPISLDEARAIVRQRIEQRDTNFLNTVDTAIYQNPRSPYLPLLKMAGCEMADLRAMVRSQGVEGTLTALRRAGVYITYEEFKGRAPIVRNGLTIPIQASDFDYPWLTQDLEVESGGSTGARVLLRVDLDHLAGHAPSVMLGFEAHGLLGMPMVFWRGLLPDGSGLGNILRAARFRHFAHEWFRDLAIRDLNTTMRNRVSTHVVVALARLFGAPVPWPKPLRPDQAIIAARSAAKLVETHGACLMRTTVGRALRVCVAAREAHLSLNGVSFLGGGEAPTPAKVGEIERAGARWIPNYITGESGVIGFGCARPVDGNDIHLFKDLIAVIQHPRAVPGSEITVDAFYFTSLLPTSPKMMLNAEIDDYGVIERRACGCLLESYGFTEHIRQIHSFRKLTTEGWTLIGSDMIRILEEVLPARFGGSALDYQFMEEEDDRGFTRLSLIVSPRVPIADDATVIEAVLQAMQDAPRAIHKQAGTLRVRRMEPIWTPRGKFLPLLPLHLARHASLSATPESPRRPT